MITQVIWLKSVIQADVASQVTSVSLLLLSFYLVKVIANIPSH